MTAPDPSDACAVWYENDYGMVDYELCDDESEAARLAAAFDREGRALGVQFPDGRFVKATDWPVFQRERVEYAKRLADSAASYVPAATRRTVDPFYGQAFTIELSEPEWLGGKQG